MPADNTLSMEPSSKHGNGNAPYPCSQRLQAPGPKEATWAIDYGWCRTSLDYHPEGYKQGSDDPRCPKDCQHKASTETAQEFAVVFVHEGAVKAAAWAKANKLKAKE